MVALLPNFTLTFTEHLSDLIFSPVTGFGGNWNILAVTRQVNNSSALFVYEKLPSKSGGTSFSSFIGATFFSFNLNLLLLLRIILFECLDWVKSSTMKSSVIPADSPYSAVLEVQPSGRVESLAVSIEQEHESLDIEESLEDEEESSRISHHPLSIKPSGNQYTATKNSKDCSGYFRICPDEVLAVLLEYLDSSKLQELGSSCKFLYALCRSDDLWKTLFIE
jgi:hypothetical protein